MTDGERIEPHKIYTPPQVVKLTGAPRDLVYGALRSGELRAVRRGRGNRRMMSGQAVMEWIEGLGSGAPDKSS